MVNFKKRQFIINSFYNSFIALGFSALPFGILFKYQNVWASKDWAFVSDDHPMAKILGYSKDQKAAEINKKAIKKTIDNTEWKSQSCFNCSLYQKLNDNSGTCPLLPNVKVHKSGICNKWQLQTKG